MQQQVSETRAEGLEDLVEWIARIDPQACFEHRALASSLHQRVDIEWLEDFLGTHEGQLDHLVKLYARGKPVDVPPRHAVPSQKRFVVSALREGATAKIEQLEHRQPDIASLCLYLERRLQVRTSAKVFVTPSGHAGYAPHLDHTDVLAIQLRGRKRWTVFGRLEESPVFGMSRLMTAHEAGEDGWQVYMQPGDVLHVAAGVGHTASCDDQYSMHVTIGMEPYTVYDVLKHRLYELALRAPQLRRRLSAGLDEDTLSRELLAGLNDLERQLMIGGEARATVAHVRRAYESARPICAGSEVRAALLPSNTGKLLVRVNAWRNCEVLEEADRIRLYASGTVVGPIPLAAPSLTLPAYTKADVLGMLAAREPTPLAELPGALDISSRSKLACALAEFGVVEVLGLGEQVC
ncbi:MAG: hypothetical protein IAE86_08940 [Burkholderiaceae bacterium]|nr:hypothetical protein [Burkholderiaceae bacterium]